MVTSIASKKTPKKHRIARSKRSFGFMRSRLAALSGEVFATANYSTNGYTLSHGVAHGQGAGTKCSAGSGAAGLSLGPGKRTNAANPSWSSRDWKKKEEKGTFLEPPPPPKETITTTTTTTTTTHQQQQQQALISRRHERNIKHKRHADTWIHEDGSVDRSGWAGARAGHTQPARQ